MTDKKITALTAADALADAHLFEVVQTAANRKATMAQLATYMNTKISGGVGPVYVASFEKDFVAADTGTYQNFTDGITLIQASADVAYNNGLGFDLWRLQPGAYLASLHTTFQASGGLGGDVGGVPVGEIKAAFNMFPFGENAAHRELFQTQAIPSNHDRSFHAMTLGGIILSPGDSEGFYVAAEFNWGNTTVNIGVYGYLMLTKLATSPTTLP